MISVIRNGVLVLAFKDNEDKQAFIKNLSSMLPHCLYFAQAAPDTPDRVMDEAIDYAKSLEEAASS